MWPPTAGGQLKTFLNNNVNDCNCLHSIMSVPIIINVMNSYNNIVTTTKLDVQHIGHTYSTAPHVDRENTSQRNKYNRFELPFQHNSLWKDMTWHLVVKWYICTVHNYYIFKLEMSKSASIWFLEDILAYHFLWFNIWCFCLDFVL